jgi:hypothetical protein
MDVVKMMRTQLQVESAEDIIGMRGGDISGLGEAHAFLLRIYEGDGNVAAHRWLAPARLPFGYRLVCAGDYIKSKWIARYNIHTTWWDCVSVAPSSVGVFRVPEGVSMAEKVDYGEELGFRLIDDGEWLQKEDEKYCDDRTWKPVPVGEIGEVANPRYRRPGVYRRVYRRQQTE